MEIGARSRQPKALPPLTCRRRPIPYPFGSCFKSPWVVWNAHGTAVGILSHDGDSETASHSRFGNQLATASESLYKIPQTAGTYAET
jgi:hypothetical protein